MLKYLIQVIQNLLTTGILIAMLFALAQFNEKHKRWPLWGFVAGTAAAFILSFLKYATVWINREYVNIGILSAVVFVEFFFYAFSWGFLQKRSPSLHEKICGALYSLLAAFLLLYALPDIFLYPTAFVMVGESIFSTDFLFKLIGYLAGLLVVVFSSLTLYKTGSYLSFKLVRILATIGLVINMVNQLVAITQPLLARRIIPMQKWLFSLLKPLINYNDWFLYVIMALTLILPLVLWRKSMRPDKTYQNPAQHRKTRAMSHRQKRYCAAILAGYTVAVLCLTVVKAYNEKEVVLSPAEPMTIVGGEIVIPLENINDGHLHRIAYGASGGIEVRFIVIQKNEVSYGVGLDACDICGPTGYYERKDEVICKLCDVVMNKSTIGFKGGCNPVPLEYSISDGSMVIKIQHLENEKKRFA